MPPKRKQNWNDQCLYCGRDQSEDPVGVKINWLKCDTCQKWTHLTCFENATSTDGSVTPELWQFISADENVKQKWVFTCSQCSGVDVSIPDQLETQNLVSRLGLRDMRIDPKFISADVPQAPETSTRSVPVYASTVTPPTTTTAPSTSTAAPDPAAMYASSTPPGDLASMFKFFLEMDMKRQRERDDLEAKRERERIELEEKMEQKRAELEAKREKEREELEQKREEDRTATEQMFLRLLDNRDERFNEMEKQRLEHEKELEKRRLQKEEELNAERMKVEERIFEQLQSGQPVTFAQTTDKQKIGLKLPFLKIPTFKGDILKWMEFWDMFCATVHDNPELSPVQKLSHLKASLEGPARESAAQLSMTNDNYDVAVELLKKRYENRRLIKEKLFGKLQDLPASSMRLDDLRRTFHTVEQSLEQLKNLDQHFAKRSCEVNLLLNMVKKKFPPEIIVEIEEDQEDDWTLKDLMPKIEHFINKYERKAQLRIELYGQKMSGSATQLRSSPQMKRKSAEFQNMRSSYESLDSLSDCESNRKPIETSSAIRKPRPCVFCGDDKHVSEICQRFATEDQRKNMLYKSKKCFICLKPGHMLRQCTHPIKTRVCPGCQKIGVHHRALCEKWFGRLMHPHDMYVAESNEEEMSDMKETTVKEVGFTAIENEGRDNSALKLSYDTLKETSATTNPKKKKVIMQIATLKVRNGENESDVNVLFDSASSVSWLAEDKAKEMKLKNVSGCTKAIPVNTFGGKQMKAQSYDAEVEIVSNKKGAIPVQVTVIPSVMSEPVFQDTFTKRDWEFFYRKDYCEKLAPGVVTARAKNYKIDMLIGQDYMWSLLFSGPMKGPVIVNLPSGLKLIKSEFGYLIGGSTCEESSCGPNVESAMLNCIRTEPKLKMWSNEDNDGEMKVVSSEMKPCEGSSNGSAMVSKQKLICGDKMRSKKAEAFESSKNNVLSGTNFSSYTSRSTTKFNKQKENLNGNFDINLSSDSMFNACVSDFNVNQSNCTHIQSVGGLRPNLPNYFSARRNELVVKKIGVAQSPNQIGRSGEADTRSKPSNPKQTNSIELKRFQSDSNVKGRRLDDVFATRSVMRSEPDIICRSATIKKLRSQIASRASCHETHTYFGGRKFHKFGRWPCSMPQPPGIHGRTFPPPECRDSRESREKM